MALLFVGLAAWAGAAPLRVLILSGANNHEWRATTPVLKAALEAGGLCQVVVTENPADLRPGDLDGLAVVLGNYNTFAKKDASSLWEHEMRAAFIAWIRQGHGFVAVHAGSSVFYDWPEFQILAGTSWGRTSRHAKMHPGEVIILPTLHPVTAGLGNFETRDEFWEGSALAAGAVVLATVTPRVDSGGSGKTEPIALATTLGAGRGFTLLLGHDAAAMKNEGFMRLLRRGTEWAATGAVSVAVADPYQERRELAAGFVKEQQGHEPKLYRDFRELLADRSIDAVVIATPDHWHVPIALAAIRAGKDLYVEKPLGYSLEQNRLLRDALKESGRVFQYGTQQRSQELMKRGAELVRNGYIGELQRIEVWAPAGRAGGSTEEIPVPAGLDYEMYLGPAPLSLCSKDRITSAASWHCADYALGFIAGWGAHPLDIAIWGMRSDTKGPIRVKGTGTFPPATDLFNAMKAWDAEFQFADGVMMRFQSSDLAMKHVETYRRKIVRDAKGTSQVPTDGTTFYGTKGWVSLSRATSEASNPEWLRLKECEGTERVVYRNHYYTAFVESVRSRGHLIAPIADAVRSDTLSHVSLLAIQSAQEVVWDPQEYRFVSPTTLNSKIAKPARGNWLRA